MLIVLFFIKYRTPLNRLSILESMQYSMKGIDFSGKIFQRSFFFGQRSSEKGSNNRMNKANYWLAVLILGVIGHLHSLHAQEFIAVEKNSVIVCPAAEIKTQEQLPTFKEPACQTTLLTNVDPQNKAIWLKASIDLPQTLLNERKPLGFYLFGKAASEVFFNDTYLGTNGTPAIEPRDEIPGNMDVLFYLPQNILKAGKNHVVINLSAHQSLVTLRSPINFMGVSQYTDVSAIFKKNIYISLMLFGALFLGAIYFLVLSLRSRSKQKYLLFFLMAAFSSTQLFAEMSRGLFGYAYPLHDIRLIVIVLLATGFGLCLLLHILVKFPQNNRHYWLLSAIVLTPISVYLIEWFDSKTAAATAVPSLISIAILITQYIRQRTKELLAYLIAFAVFVLVMVLNFNQFHDLMFYYIITAMMFFLFIKQANALVKEQLKRKTEQEQVAKLQLKLDQNKQTQTPQKLKISSAGKVELISTNDILFCKAAGDYVEIHLNQQRQVLYSGSLKSLESQLPSTFLKVHRSYLVNLDGVLAIKSVRASSGSASGFLVLNENIEIPVSRRILPMVKGVIEKI